MMTSPDVSKITSTLLFAADCESIELLDLETNLNTIGKNIGEQQASLHDG